MCQVPPNNITVTIQNAEKWLPLQRWRGPVEVGCTKKLGVAQEEIINDHEPQGVIVSIVAVD